LLGVLWYYGDFGPTFVAETKKCLLPDEYGG